jgi:hypothetical protein
MSNLSFYLKRSFEQDVLLSFSVLHKEQAVQLAYVISWASEYHILNTRRFLEKKVPILGVFLLTVQIFPGGTTHNVKLRQLAIPEVQIGSLIN